MFFKTSGIDVTTASERSGANGLLIDVRTKAEWRSGHAPGATHVSLDSLVQRMDWLKRAADGGEVMVICRSGNRSAQAIRQLKSGGIDAVNVRGGMIAWERAGLPMKKGS